MSTRYTITVTAAQTRTMADALDFYTRVVGLCQLDEVAWAHREHIDTATPEGHERAEVLSRCMDDAALRSAGISAGTIRLSIGLEDADDLIDDLKRALRTAEKAA